MTQRGPIGNRFRRNAAMRRPRGGFAGRGAFAFDGPRQKLAPEFRLSFRQ